MVEAVEFAGVTVDPQALTDFTIEVFEAAGMPRPYAELQAGILVWANLRGIDSHGVLRIPWYVKQIDEGDLVPDAVVEVISETPATALLNAHGAPGPVATCAGVEKAVEKAKACGTSWVVVGSCTHNGALAYYTEKIAKAGLIGMTTVCSPANMAPFGARAAGLHNSPVSIGIPAHEHAPILLDMATSIAAGGKIYHAADRGVSIPEGWALDKMGNPTTDPNQAEIWLPLGAKGSGLAMMFECWSSLLAANPLCTPRIADPSRKTQSQNAMVMAVDVGAFLPLDQYCKLVDELIDAIKGLPPAGPTPVMVPGELENALYEKRGCDGIVLPNGTTSRLEIIATRFGVETPW